MEDFDLTMNQLARAIRVSPNRVTAIIHGTRGITAETAMRLARYFGTSVEMWMNMQARYEMEVARDAFEGRISKEIQPRESKAA
jgi:addiction module HigA family antidote